MSNTTSHPEDSRPSGIPYSLQKLKAHLENRIGESIVALHSGGEKIQGTLERVITHPKPTGVRGLINKDRVELIIRGKGEKAEAASFIIEDGHVTRAIKAENRYRFVTHTGWEIEVAGSGKHHKANAA